MMQSETVRHRFFSIFLLVLSFLFYTPKIFAADAAAPAATSAPAATATPAASGVAVAPAADEAIGLVIWVKGEVKAIRSDAPHVLQRRDPIYVHDKIVTNTEGSGEISFSDNSVFTLRSDTEFQVDSYNYKKDQPPGEQKSVMSLIKGGFRTITGAVPKENPTGYQVNTPVATIGVRGTDYTVFYDSAKGLLAQINSGSIAIKNAYGSLELNKSTLNEIYGSVPLSGAPMLMPKQPNELAPQPPLTPVSDHDKFHGGGGYHGPGGPGGPGGGGFGRPHTGVTNNFCISYLEDLYDAIKRMIG